MSRAVLLCAAFAPLVAAADPTLRELASKLGVFVGSALNQACIQNTSDPDYASTSIQQYNLATAENECKFPSTEPSQGVFDFTGCDFVSNFMLKNGSGVFRGHNFVWGQSNPSWLLKGGFSPSQLEGIMQAHIAAVGGRYKDAFFCFDVVNEAVADSGNETLKPAAPWYPAIPNYVDLAFQYARAAMPNVKLFYNDYGAEASGSAKSDKVYAMVSGMRARGVPIDGVGLQMHISVDGYPAPAAVEANIQRLGALGLDVHITEMDVACKPPCGADRLALQAQVYGDILGACLSQPACKSFETWGFTDLHTWLWSFNNPTHENMQPLPFDVAYAPKPAFGAMIAKLQAALQAREAIQERAQSKRRPVAH